MRYLGLFDPSKVAYDGAGLRPAVPIAANAITATVEKAMVAAPTTGTHDFARPDPGAGGAAVVVAGETPSGAPIVMQKASEPEEGPAYFASGGGGAVVPINDREASGPPAPARDRASISASATVDDGTILAIGVGLVLLAGVAYVATRKKRRAA